MKNTHILLVLFATTSLLLAACGSSLEPSDTAAETSAITEQTDDSAAEVKEESLPQKAYVTAPNGLRMRAGAGRDFETIGSLPPQTEVTIIERSDVPLEVQDNGQTIQGFWVKVAADNKQGYVFDGYLAETNFMPLSRFDMCFATSFFEAETRKLSDSMCVANFLDFQNISLKAFTKAKAKHINHITTAGVVTEKENDVLKMLGANGTIELADVVGEHDDQMQRHEFVGAVKKRNLFLVKRQYYEGSELLLIDSETGKIYNNDDQSFWGTASFSHDASQAVLLENNPYEQTANLQWVDFSSGTPKMVYNAAFPNWALAGKEPLAYWDSENSFVFEIANAKDFWFVNEMNDQESGYAKITRLE